MYYLRSRAAADAIKFTVDTSILKVKMINNCDLLIYLFPPFFTLVIGSHRKRLNQWTVMMKSKWLRLFAPWKTEKSAWLVEVRMDQYGRITEKYFMCWGQMGLSAGLDLQWHVYGICWIMQKKGSLMAPSSQHQKSVLYQMRRHPTLFSCIVYLYY